MTPSPTDAERRAAWARVRWHVYGRARPCISEYLSDDPKARWPKAETVRGVIARAEPDMERGFPYVREVLAWEGEELPIDASGAHYIAASDAWSAWADCEWLHGIREDAAVLCPRCSADCLGHARDLRLCCPGHTQTCWHCQSIHGCKEAA